MNEKSWVRFWQGLVLPRKQKLVLGEKNFVSRSPSLDRTREERAIRLMRVVRFLRREGFSVEREDDRVWMIWDERNPPDAKTKRF